MNKHDLNNNKTQQKKTKKNKKHVLNNDKTTRLELESNIIKSNNELKQQHNSTNNSLNNSKNSNTELELTKNQQHID